jgi:hypothetical protein
MRRFAPGDLAERMRIAGFNRFSGSVSTPTR